MADKKYRANPKKIQTKKSVVLYNYAAFKETHVLKLQMLAFLLFIFFCISLFKNISYPLFWGDEGATGMGIERVVKFGYPKVHDGKNTLQFQQQIDENLLVNKKNDAYLGEGPDWSMYYYGVIPYKLSKSVEDLYLKTGIYRSSYAILSLLGLIILGFSISKFFDDKFSKYGFISLLLFFELTAISVVLILREVRYYPLAVFFTCTAISMYLIFRFYKSYNRFLYVSILAIVIWLQLNTFFPIGVIICASIGISEFCIAADHYIRTKNIKHTILSVIIPILPVIIAFAAMLPVLSYFKTVEMASALSKFYGYNISTYIEHLSSVLSYFIHFEPFWLELGLKILILLSIKKLLEERPLLFKISNFLTLFFIVFVLSISRIFLNVFTRYFITLEPFFCSMVVVDLFLLIRIYGKNSSTPVNKKLAMLLFFASSMIGYTFYKNLPDIKGHLYEMTHQYKGPLDCTIPYIHNNFKKPDTLVIATNQEETSYVFYLGSKIILNSTEMELGKDSLLQPEIIAFRKSAGSAYSNLYNNFFKRAHYVMTAFPVQDSYINNIPEFNCPNPLIDHRFKTLIALDAQNQTDVFILSSMLNKENH